MHNLAEPPSSGGGGRVEDRSSARVCDEVAVGAGAVAGVVTGGAVRKCLEGLAGGVEFVQAPIDVVEALVDERGDMVAERLAVVADGKDLADLGQGEAAGLGGVDEAKAIMTAGS